MKLYLRSLFNKYKQNGKLITKECLEIIETKFDRNFLKNNLIVKIIFKNGLINIIDFTEGHILISQLKRIFEKLQKRLDCQIQFFI